MLRFMNASEASCLLESIRPKDIECGWANEAEGQLNHGEYMRWLREARRSGKFDVQAEDAKYYDPFYAMGREDYTGKCERCGQALNHE
jgi:hypothetical protein